MVTETPLHVWAFPVRIRAATAPPSPPTPLTTELLLPTPPPGKGRAAEPTFLLFLLLPSASLAPCSASRGPRD